MRFKKKKSSLILGSIVLLKSYDFVQITILVEGFTTDQQTK